MQDYQLLNQVGEGSFGRVYKARRKYTGMTVAIKMIKKDQSPEDLESLRQEINILRMVDHPNIMRVIDVFETDKDFCVVSEFGVGDLYLAIKGQRLSEKTIKRIAAQLISALKYLHNNKIIHRDLKPQNVLIGPNKIVKICDFGFARALSSSTVFLTSVKGTPLYMAPELIKELPYDEKVDIWSLGVILFELYFQKPPFFATSLYQLIGKIVDSAIIFPGQISESFKSFLMMMLQKDPSQRCTCSDLEKHPFVSRVDLSQFSDSNYICKKKQFEAALKESFADGKFQASKQPLLDPLIILTKPLSFPDEQLKSAISEIYEKDVDPDSPLAQAFITNFTPIIRQESVIEYSLLAANLLMRKDTSLSPKFFSGIEILRLKNLPSSIVEFLIRLLVLPSSIHVINNEKNTVEIKLNNFSEFRDILRGFLFLPDSIDIKETYSVISYLASNSQTFLESLCKPDFLPTFLPIVTSLVFNHPSPLVKASILSIMTHIVRTNENAIQFILPREQFLSGLSKIMKSDLNDIETFCMFSACLSFVSNSLNKCNLFKELTIDPNEIFSIECISSLIKCGSMEPKTESDFLSYVSITSSPFTHIPLTNEISNLCISNLSSLYPIHQQVFVKRYFLQNYDSFSSHISSCIIPLIDNEYCSEFTYALLIDLFKRNSEHREDISKDLVEHDILLKLATSLKNQSINKDIYELLDVLIASLTKSTEKLEKQAPLFLDGIFDDPSMLKKSLHIASHLAWLSEMFVQPIIDSNGLNAVLQGLKKPQGFTTTFASQIIGHICKYRPLPIDYIRDLMPLLLKQLNHIIDCAKWASYAIGNCLYQVPESAEFLIDHLDLFLKLLVKSNDLKIIENTSIIFSNFVRKNDKYLNVLIQKGVLLQVLNLLETKIEVADRIIRPLSVFCRYEQAKDYFRKNDAINKLRKYMDITTSKRTQENILYVLKCLE